MATLEWPATIDAGLLRMAGWRPRPLRQFIFKVHSRCNLACDYCYMYMAADQSWRGRPRLMPVEVIAAAARRIAGHVRTHEVPEIGIILHGGEPLLAGAEYLEEIVGTVRAACPPDLRIRAVVQTNGLLLTPECLDVLARSRIRVGVSIDGGEAVNDLHRRHADGRGSYDDVARALRTLMAPERRAVYGGLLCTINVDTDPLRVHNDLLAFDPPMIDYLLPHATWEDPPPPGHADWLIAIFDHWYGAASGSVRIRLFEEIIHLLLGGTSGNDTVGLTPEPAVVIETDGEIEQLDSLKIVAEGAPSTGMNVATHDFDEALLHPGMIARQLGWEALCDTCRGCPYGQVCGGGLYPHRYAPGTGFRNPSVYCADLFRLIEHIHHRVQRDLHGDHRDRQKGRAGGDEAARDNARRVS